MNMAINVYEYGREGKCVYMFSTGMREMKMQMKKEFRHMSRVMRTSVGTVTEVSIEFVEKKERKQKGGYK